MSRAKIAGVVAAVVVGLTLAAYFLTTSSLEARIEKESEARVKRARDLIHQVAQLEGLGLIRRTERLAANPIFLRAVAESNDVARAQIADEAFRQFIAELPAGDPKPDNIVIVDAKGEVAAMLDVPRPDNEEWKSKYPAIAAAIDKRQVSNDVWEYRNSVMKVGVAPFFDPQTGDVKGALTLFYALNAREAQEQARVLGLDVAYLFGDRVRATSFRRGGKAEEDVEKQKDLAKPVYSGGLAAEAFDKGIAEKVVKVELGKETYLASAVRLPNFSAKSAGAVVLVSLTQALAPIGTAKLAILLLGVGALLIAILAMFVTARLILHPAEEIELGVTEIINGNIDYTFKPVGADFDGLANALNVMLARLLGRPEPGDETYDENGNVQTTKVLLDDDGMPSGAANVATSPEVLALAQEPEGEYYARVYREYLEGRKQTGEGIDGVTFDSFTAKLRISEANLKKKYACKSVRFRVATKNGQITLKPVPIF